MDQAAQESPAGAPKMTDSGIITAGINPISPEAQEIRETGMRPTGPVTPRGDESKVEDIEQAGNFEQRSEEAKEEAPKEAPNQQVVQSGTGEEAAGLIQLAMLRISNAFGSFIARLNNFFYSSATAALETIRTHGAAVVIDAERIYGVQKERWGERLGRAKATAVSLPAKATQAVGGVLQRSGKKLAAAGEGASTSSQREKEA